MRALDVLGLEVDADLEMIKKSYRLLAKQNHPDTNPDDEDAAQRFQAIQLSYQVLKSAAERREWKPAGE
jgi:curved DNA-binding protein CbpA